MSADDAQWRICADDAYLMRRCVFGLYDARIRILRMLCADAHNAQIRMCAAAHACVCVCVYAHIMLILSVDAHTMRICARGS